MGEGIAGGACGGAGRVGAQVGGGGRRGGEVAEEGEGKAGGAARGEQGAHFVPYVFILRYGALAGRKAKPD